MTNKTKLTVQKKIVTPVISFVSRAKLKPLNVLLCGSEFIDVFCSLGEEQNLNNYIIRKLERFVIHIYGKQTISQSLSIDDVREK